MNEEKQKQIDAKSQEVVPFERSMADWANLALLMRLGLDNVMRQLEEDPAKFSELHKVLRVSPKADCVGLMINSIMVCKTFEEELNLLLVRELPPETFGEALKEFGAG